MNSFLKNRDFYSFGALLLTLIGEACAIIGIQGYCGKWLYGTLLALALVVLLRLLALCYGVKFGPMRVILTKLLANAITPRWLGVLYLLFFVLHIGWLSNAIHGLFSTSDGGFCYVLISVIVSSLGLLSLIVFFPNARTMKSADCEQVFFTGISSINIMEEAWPQKYEGLNIIPLVRILQLLNDNGNDSRMVILLTDAFKNDMNTFAVLKHIMTLVNPKATDEIEKHCTVQDKLALLIREVAKREFPNKARQIERMIIEFTEPCSYFDNFDVTFNTLEKRAKELDNAEHQLYFNLTPGTGIIGSLMTLMAIDGDRELYYYSQEKMPNEETATNEEKELFKIKLLKPVDKSKVPLQALLSQALESIK